ncbi:MAG TPA: arsenic resistance N-acetyltransferase ArsN2 [Steroidobacteraceae bacterium]|nr:arsenic resistance N-acetyltransferase ArsN2 [Steroidobacteraceae bacterium]
MLSTRAQAPVTLRAATPHDAAAIRDLLERCRLPTDDLATSHPEFVVACAGARIIGTGALERFGEVGLLRSVALEAQWRGAGVGRLIVEELERRASASGVRELILLTLTARAFFERLGYSEKDRAQVSPAVRESAEFRSLCPASALCMTRNLTPK